MGGSVYLSPGKNIGFYETGILKAAFLERDANFTLGNKQFTFAKGSHIKIYEDGNIEHGYTLNPLRLKDDKKEYRVPAKSIIKFNRKGEITNVRTIRGLQKVNGPVIILKSEN